MFNDAQSAKQEHELKEILVKNVEIGFSSRAKGGEQKAIGIYIYANGIVYTLGRTVGAKIGRNDKENKDDKAGNFEGEISNASLEFAGVVYIRCDDVQV